jgi:large subunit ribosomal protein L4e
MELPILSATNEKRGTKKMPIQFDEPVRPDLIKRAVLALQSKRRQAYGSAPGAGQRASAKISRRRRDYKTSYGHGISRVPRKILTRRGTRMNWVGAVAPGTVGGRRAHPPKPWKIWDQKINEKERKKAIRSCLAASVSRPLAEARQQYVPPSYPFILDSSIEDIKTCKELAAALGKLGITAPPERKVRVGKGKARGRRHRAARGILIVVSKECNLCKAARNIPAVEVSTAKSLNAEKLAPGAQCGRVTLYTASSVEAIEQEHLFV